MSRDALHDITNTVPETPSVASTSKRTSLSSSRPKVFRQTSLFAFAAARTAPICGSSSSPTASYVDSDEGYDSLLSDEIARDYCEDVSEQSSRKRLRVEERLEARSEDDGDVDVIKQARRARCLARNRGEVSLSLGEIWRLREYASGAMQSKYLADVSGKSHSSFNTIVWLKMFLPA